MSIHRRSFLRGALATAALSTGPSWFRKAWAAPEQGTLRIFDAYRRARRAHMPLLVLVVPALPEGSWGRERYQRGGSLGAYLTHGTREELAPLALVHMVCATMEEVNKLSPIASDKEPAFVLIETDRVPARTRIARVELEYGPDYYDEDWDEVSHVDANTARIARAIADLVSPTGSIPAIDEATRERIARSPVPGARWAHSTGCGTTYEDNPDEGRGYACGMGHVPEKSARFLSFLADLRKDEL